MSEVKQRLCSCLPDCMMPDGAEPCGGYLKLYGEIDRLEKQNAILREAVEGQVCRCGVSIFEVGKSQAISKYTCSRCEALAKLNNGTQRGDK